MATKAKPDYMAQLAAAGDKGLIVSVSNGSGSIHWRAADTLPKDRVEFRFDKWGRRIVRLAAALQSAADDKDAELAALRARCAALEAALTGAIKRLEYYGAGISADPIREVLNGKR